MGREHQLGTTTFAGCQIRYLIASDHGYLGAVGFSAAAHALADRDCWIGWDRETRCRRLNRIVNLSRFLIRPGVDCKNLASKVLSMSLRRLPTDFEIRYGFRPGLAETFVGSGQDGASFAASNWIRIGATKGRGRFAEPGVRVPVKSIFVFPLASDWRETLGGTSARVEPLEAGAGLDRVSWADNEFGGAPLGDLRLGKRLVKSAAAMSLFPAASFFKAARKKMAKVTGYYRMIDQPADSPVTPENILVPHRGRTLRRMQHAKTVLCIQDGSDLNFDAYGACQGLGLNGKNQGSKGTPGLHMHAMLVLDGNGVPLGMPRVEFGPQEKNAGDGEIGAPRKTRRWVRVLEECSAFAAQLDGVRPLSIMDREADAFEIFDERRRLGNVDILVRATHVRCLGRGQAELFDMIKDEPARGSIKIKVGRSSGHRADGSQESRTERPARIAPATLRWRTATLPPARIAPATLRWRTATLPPARAATNRVPPVTVNIVHLCEETPPDDGGKPLEWFLLTTLPVKIFKQAVQIVEFYLQRWLIEGFFNILKSGGKVEQLSHHSADRIERAVYIKAVIAWRLAAMTMLGRGTPELDASVLFSDVSACVCRFPGFEANHRRNYPTGVENQG